jgi:putative exosortase-affiliated protein, TIGR04073 family
MVKRSIFAIIALSVIISFATPAFCGDAATKLGRGMSNMATFALEIPEQISRSNNSDGPFAACTVGVLKGLGCAVGRACVGVYEAATFMFPGSKNYEPVLNDPEYFLESSNL